MSHHLAGWAIEVEPTNHYMEPVASPAPAETNREEHLFSDKYGQLPGVREAVAKLQHFEDILTGIKWVAAFAVEDEYRDVTFKFKETKRGDLLVKVKDPDGNSNGWYQGSVTSDGLLIFSSDYETRWTGNVHATGGYISFNVTYGDGGYEAPVGRTVGAAYVGAVVAVPLVWDASPTEPDVGIYMQPTDAIFIM